MAAKSSATMGSSSTTRTRTSRMPSPLVDADAAAGGAGTAAGAAPAPSPSLGEAARKRDPRPDPQQADQHTDDELVPERRLQGIVAQQVGGDDQPRGQAHVHPLLPFLEG